MGHFYAWVGSVTLLAISLLWLTRSMGAVSDRSAEIQERILLWLCAGLVGAALLFVLLDLVFEFPSPLLPVAPRATNHFLAVSAGYLFVNACVPQRWVNRVPVLFLLVPRSKGAEKPWTRALLRVIVLLWAVVIAHFAWTGPPEREGKGHLVVAKGLGLILLLLRIHFAWR